LRYIKEVMDMEIWWEKARWKLRKKARKIGEGMAIAIVLAYPFIIASLICGMAIILASLFIH